MDRPALAGACLLLVAAWRGAGSEEDEELLGVGAVGDCSVIVGPSSASVTTNGASLLPVPGGLD
jgi:hypothetical protein